MIAIRLDEFGGQVIDCRSGDDGWRTADGRILFSTELAEYTLRLKLVLPHSLRADDLRTSPAELAHCLEWAVRAYQIEVKRYRRAKRTRNRPDACRVIHRPIGIAVSNYGVCVISDADSYFVGA
jgi:hypothetical protein